MTCKTLPAFVAAAALAAAAFAPRPTEAGGEAIRIVPGRIAAPAPVGRPLPGPSGMTHIVVPPTGSSGDREATRPSIAEAS